MKLNFKIALLLLLIFAGCSNEKVTDIEGLVFNVNITNNITSNEHDGESIKVSPVSDFFVEVAKQRLSTYSYVHKFGRNNDVDTLSGFEAVWSGGGDYTGFPTETETLEIFSSDINDDLGATGAWNVTITGLLNSTFHIQPDITVNLNGTTPVSLGSGLYYRANRMIVRSAGSSGANEGVLTLRHTLTTANIFAIMEIGYSQTMITALTVPFGKRGFLLSWYASLGNKVKGVSEIRLLMRPNGEVWQVKEEFSLFADGNSYVLREYKIPKKNIKSGTDIKVMADSTVNNLGVASGLDFLFEDIT